MKTFALKLKTSDGEHLIDPDTIIRIEALSNYCKIYFSDGKTLVAAKVLKWFEEKLPPQSFLRMHRSHIINNHFLESYQDINKGLLLVNGECIRASRRKRKWILHQLQVA